MSDINAKAGYILSPWASRVHSRKEREVFIAGAAGPGKALCLSTLVPTPIGFRYFKDIKPGDIVFNVRGEQVKVLAETQIWTDRPCYKLQVADEVITADAEHLWNTQDGRILTTQQIHESTFNTQLPFASCVEMAKSDLPIDPYVLGVCLVRGQPSDRSKFTTWCPEIYSALRDIGYTLDDVAFKIGQIRERKDLINELIPAKGRRIPTQYMQASLHQRIALVEGIIDGGGGYCPTVDYADYPFLIDFYCLCSSLGFGPRITQTRDKKHYYLHLYSKKFKLSRRTGTVGINRTQRLCHRIKSIKRCESVPVKCITVSDGGTFLITKSYIPTHNSMTLLMDPVTQIQIEHLRMLQDDKAVDAAISDPKLREIIKKNPIHRGHSEGSVIHLRRTLPRLTETINRSKRIFPVIDPEMGINGFREKDHTWTFSSGLTFKFGHCKDRGDHINYLGLQYCVAKDTNVVMADSSLKKIQDIVSGDYVQTLQGAKKVTATWDSGVKLCVRSSILYRGELVGTQLHPSTHPVLVWPTSLSNSEQTEQNNQRGQQYPGPSSYWLDYESLLCGLPKSPVKRASLINEETYFSMSCGAHPRDLRLPKLTVPVVLHRQTLLSALSNKLKSSQFHRSESCYTGSSKRTQVPERLASGSFLGLSPTCESRPSRSCHEELSPVSYDATCALDDSGTTKGSLLSCSICSCLHGEQLHFETAPSQERAQQPICVGELADKHCCVCNSQDSVQQHIQVHPSNTFENLYTKERQVLTEDVCMGTMEMEVFDFVQTYDLTVEGVNHYITENGSVQCQSHIAFDELVEFNKEQYEFITSRLRTGDDVLRPFMKVLSASNPRISGNKGEDIAIDDPTWVKKYFVDPWPDGNKVIRKKVVRKDGSSEYVSRIYIPATLYDNPNEQFIRDYELTLLSKPKHIRDAYLYGRWDSVVGSHFGEIWNPTIHVCKPFKIPKDWPVFRAMDWGWATSGVVLYFAVDPDNTLYCFYEMTFKHKTATEVAHMIKYFEEKNKLWDPEKGSKCYGPADNQIKEERGSSFKNKYEEFVEVGVDWCNADKRSREVNCEVFTARLMSHQNFTRKPGIIFFENCRQCIQTIPSLNTDPGNLEVPVKGGSDHHYDTVTYACQYAKQSGMTPPKYTDESSYREDDDVSEAWY